MSQKIMIASFCITMLVVANISLAEDDITNFTGAIDFGLKGPPKDTIVLRIADQKSWDRFLAKLPKLVPGRTTRLDTPNDNPALKAKIDWSKSMAIVAMGGSEIPNIEFAGPKEAPAVKGESGDIFLVEVSAVADFSAHPVDWGTFVAKVVPRSTRKLVVRKVKAKPVEIPAQSASE